MTEQNKDQRPSQELDDEQLDLAVGGRTDGTDDTRREQSKKAAAEGTKKAD